MAKGASNDRLNEEVKKYRSMFEGAYDILETKSREEYQKIEELRAQFEEVVHQLELTEGVLEQRTSELKKSESDLEAAVKTTAELNNLLEAASLSLNTKDAEKGALEIKFAQLEDSNNSNIFSSSPGMDIVPKSLTYSCTTIIGLKASLENGEQASTSAQSR